MLYLLGHYRGTEERIYCEERECKIFSGEDSRSKEDEGKNATRHSWGMLLARVAPSVVVYIVSDVLQ